jgi:hypothetical protein
LSSKFYYRLYIIIVWQLWITKWNKTKKSLEVHYSGGGAPSWDCCFASCCLASAWRKTRVDLDCAAVVFEYFFLLEFKLWDRKSPSTKKKARHNNFASRLFSFLSLDFTLSNHHYYKIWGGKNAIKIDLKKKARHLFLD